MGRNLGPLNIKDTYEGLVQISSSLQLTDGSGSLIPSVEVTASNANNAVSSSHAVNADLANDALKLNIQGNVTDTDFLLPYFDVTGGVGFKDFFGNSAFTYNPSTRILSVENIDGTITNATSASRADSAASADVAQKVRTLVDTTDAERYLTYVENANGDYPINVDANLTFNPSTNNLTTDTFTGALVGNADTATSASHALQADNAATAISASYATTASFALNASTPNLQEVTDQGAGTTNAITIESADSTQFRIKKNNADKIRFQTTTSNVRMLITSEVGETGAVRFVGIGDHEIRSAGDLTINTETGKLILTDVSASGYISASEFIGPLTGNATTATSASYATTASYAKNVTTPTLQNVLNAGDTANGDIRLTTTDNIIRTPNLEVYYTAGIDNFTRFTSSFGELTIEQDSDGFNFKSTPHSGIDGIIAFTSGSGQLLVINPVQNLITSNLPISASGYVSASAFIGPLTGNATTATTATTASYVTGSNVVGAVDNAVSASYATTASFALNAGASTLQQVLDTGNIATGSAYIVGSLQVGNSGSSVPSPTNRNVNLAVKDSITNNASYSMIAASDNAEITGGDSNSIIGGGNARINGGGGQSNTILGSRDVTIGSTQNTNGILCAEFSEISGGAGIGNTIIAGYNNRINAGGYNFIIAKENNTISSGNGYNAIIGAFGGNISAGRDQTIVGGNGHTISSSGNKNTIIGGDNHIISSAAERSVIIGGANLTNTESDLVVIPSLEYTGSLKLGKTNSITGTHGFAIGTTISQITGASNHGVIGGTLNVSTHDNSVVIGGQNLSTTKADQVVVPNLRVSGSVESHVINIPITSNTGSIDCNDSNFFTITLQNGVDTHLTATNLKAGQTINVQVNQNATSAGTLSYNSNIFKFESGIPFSPTGNTGAIDILTMVSFDGGTLNTVGVKNFG